MLFPIPLPGVVVVVVVSPLIAADSLSLRFEALLSDAQFPSPPPPAPPPPEDRDFGPEGVSGCEEEDEEEEDGTSALLLLLLLLLRLAVVVVVVTRPEGASVKLEDRRFIISLLSLICFYLPCARDKKNEDEDGREMRERVCSSGEETRES